MTKKYIFDVTHLIKCVRNNLLNNNYEFENKTVKWEHIQNLYNLDKNKDNTMCTTINIKRLVTKPHINIFFYYSQYGHILTCLKRHTR